MTMKELVLWKAHLCDLFIVVFIIGWLPVYLTSYLKSLYSEH